MKPKKVSKVNCVWILFFNILKFLVVLEYFAESYVNHEPQLPSSGFPSVVVELGIVCDKDFSQAFDFNENQIYQSLLQEVRSMEVDFQTLQSVKVSFVINKIEMLRSLKDQPFIEAAKNASGFADPTSVLHLFSHWIYKTEIAWMNDVVILVMKSEGIYSGTSIQAKACFRDHKTKQDLSVIVLRKPPKTWSERNVLTVATAKLLGSSRDTYTECEGQGWIMDEDEDAKSSSHFSSCTDKAILNFIQSQAAACLYSSQSYTGAPIYNDNSSNPPSSIDGCHLWFHKHESTAFSGGNRRCKDAHKHCHNNPIDAVSGEIKYPIYDTPCDTNMFCFRDQCLPSGSLLRHNNSNKCLLSSSTHFYNQTIRLSFCSSYVFRFDKVMFKNHGDQGTFLIATDNRADNPDKCLCVNKALSVVFDICPPKNTCYSRFAWDIFSKQNKSDQFYLCNRRYLKCISTNENDELVLIYKAKPEWMVIGDPYDTAYHNKTQYSNTDLIQLYGHERVSSVIRLALACDADCGSIFRYNETKLDEFWKLTLAKVNSKFRTLPSLNISFAITSSKTFLALKGSNHVSHLHNGTKKSLKDLNKQFGQIMFKEQAKVSNFDVAVLASGREVTDKSMFAIPGSVCKIKHHQFLGTVTFRIKLDDGNACDDLADALATVLGVDTRHEDESCECSDNPYTFSKCKEDLMRRMLISSAGSCIRNINVMHKPLNKFKETSMVVPTLEQQCNGFQENKDLEVMQERTDNCHKVSCLQKGAVVRYINPIDRTQCGTNKWCYHGACVQEAYQLQNVHSGLCIVETNRFVSNDHVHVGKCSEIGKSLTIFVTQQGTLMDGKLLSTSYISSSGAEQYKCLKVNPTKYEVRYKQCPRRDYKKFDWVLFPVYHSNHFVLFHKFTQKCVGINRNLSLYLSSECQSESDIALRWQKLEQYNVSALAVNGYGDQEEGESGRKSIDTPVIPNTSEHGSSWHIYLYGVLALILVAIIGVVAIWITQKHLKQLQNNIQNIENALGQTFYNGAVDKIDPHLNVAQQTELLPFDSKWEFPMEKLKMTKKLGDGAFGTVLKAQAFGIIENEIETTVAVKTLEATAKPTQVEALKSELKILCHIGKHLNVVNLLGACTKEFSTTYRFYVIIDYCKFGCLRNFLQDNKALFINNVSTLNDLSTSNQPEPGIGVTEAEHSRNSNSNFSSYHGDYTKLEIKPFDTEDILVWAFQIARGMEYLESRNVLHGDLAARNVLLAERNVVKICDFGLSKQLSKTYNYNYKKCEKKLQDVALPYKWMAIESMTIGLFSTQSDVWAFGVVIWELFSLGDSPYPGIQVNKKFIADISDGYRMDKPPFAPSRLYDIMLQCWSQNPNLRPKFSSLAETLGKMLTTELRNYYVQLNEEFQNQNTAKYSETPDYLLIMRGSQIRNSQCKYTDDSEEYLVPLERGSVYYRPPSKLTGGSTTDDESNRCLLPKVNEKADENI